MSWDENNDKLAKTFHFPTYMDGIRFVQEVANAAEELNHHPDITIGYKRVAITTTTHDVGNKVTAKDKSLATKIDQAFEKFK